MIFNVFFAQSANSLYTSGAGRGGLYVGKLALIPSINVHYSKDCSAVNMGDSPRPWWLVCLDLFSGISFKAVTARPCVTAAFLIRHRCNQKGRKCRHAASRSIA